jgi:hypothetical protein
LKNIVIETIDGRQRRKEERKLVLICDNDPSKNCDQFIDPIKQKVMTEQKNKQKDCSYWKHLYCELEGTRYKIRDLLLSPLSYQPIG